MDCVPIREELMEGRSTGLTQCLRLAMAALLCTACSSGTTTAAEGSAAARPTLAVLPFDNDSGAARQQFLAEGMTDEIAVALSAVPGLAVVARSSSFQVKLPPAPLPPRAAESRERAKAAGVALNARYLVEGATRIFADDRARIAARLVEANDG